MSEGPGFDEDGVATDNPGLRRVTFEDDGPDDKIFLPDSEPRGIWIPLGTDVRRFTMRVEQPGVFTVEMLDDDLGWGIEWVQDE